VSKVRTDPLRHGLENFQFNGFKVDMICDARKPGTKSARVTINSGGDFTLKMMAGNQTMEKKIHAGNQVFDVAIGEAGKK
jgi:hypothetical protein